MEEGANQCACGAMCDCKDAAKPCVCDKDACTCADCMAKREA